MAIEERGPQIAAVGILFLVLTWIAVVLRCYVRLFITKSFGSDDWFSGAALMTFTPYCILVIVGVQYGTGRHLVDLPEEDIPISMKFWWINELLYVTSCALAKASIAIFLGRICIRKYQIIIIWVVMVAVTIFTIYYLFLIIFQCNPVSHFWEQFEGKPGECVSAVFIANSTYTHGAINIWSDFTLCTLPLFIVWNLNMNTRTKMSVALILSLGALGSIATIVRIPYIYQLSQTDDFLYANTDVAIWSTVEPGLGITAGAMACLRPLFRTFLSTSRLLGSSRTRYPNNGRYAPRAGYFRSRQNGVVEELGLHEERGGSKRAYVEMTTRSPNGEQDPGFEMSLSSSVRKTESTTTLKGEMRI